MKILLLLTLITLSIAFICSAINNIHDLGTRIKQARKRKKTQAQFLKTQAALSEQKQTLAKQSVCRFLYNTADAHYFSNCIITAIHLFSEQQTPILRPNGYPFNSAENLKLLLSAVHPDCKFPSKGYALKLDKCEYVEKNKIFNAWFAPYNNQISGFVVQKVNKESVSLLHGRFGTLCLPIPNKRTFRKGDSVKVMQSSKPTDSGYLVSYHII